MWTSRKNAASPALGGGGTGADPAPGRACLSRHGFTLLEVLVALTILSVILIALHQAFATNIHLTGYNRSLWRAMIYAHNELQRYERLPPPSISFNEGDFENNDPMAGYHWKREIIDDSPFPGVRLRKVLLEISWSEGAGVRSFSSETYVLPK